MAQAKAAEFYVKIDGVMERIGSTEEYEVSIRKRRLKDEEGGFNFVLGSGDLQLKELVPEEAQSNAPYTYEDIVANLVRRVGKLEQKLTEVEGVTSANHDNLRTFAESLEATKHLTERNEQDIADLDERTQPKELAETVLGNITIRRSMYGDY